MEITEVKVFPVKEEKLKAFVSIVIDDCFMVNDIKIIQGRDSRFISMPSRRKKSGDFKDVAHPLNSDTRQKLEHRILAEYDRVRGVRRDAEPEVSVEIVTTVVEEPEREMELVVEESLDKQERTLKEVADKHLSDSFWTS
jgi:stage V sporulation protein G